MMWTNPPAVCNRCGYGRKTAAFETFLVAPGQLALNDDLSAPTLLVDSIAGVMNVNGVVVFNLGQTVLRVYDAANMAPEQKVVLRLAMPAGSVQGFAEAFRMQAEQMIADGSVRLAGTAVDATKPE